MNEIKTGFRAIAPGISSATVEGALVMPSRSISEVDIAEFCGGCDLLMPDNACQVTDSGAQARYADRRWCGWASVHGVRLPIDKSANS